MLRVTAAIGEGGALRKTRWIAAAIAIAAVAVVAPASANHSWGGYHWARTANPFTLQLGDNFSTSWKPYLTTASSDWSASSVLDTVVVPGKARNKNCRATSGRVEVCNGTYGQNGWLGLAQIWITSGNHITQGVFKVNDTYFSMAKYNNASEKLHVVCQEVGHTFGLDHQDESGISLDTCMDYYFNTSASDTRSTHPNAHDYEQLEAIYAHLDSTTTVGGTSGQLPDAVPSFAPATKKSKSKYVEKLKNGDTLVTFVIWVDDVG
jgi:hypothetical protein